MKRIGFLSFGHWQDVPGSQVLTGRDALLQTIELAVAAEEVGVSGAYVRVHHFARQLASPFPLLAAMAARTSTIELGTAVIDMRYENPLYMAEEAAIADLISGGRLQLGISRGSPEPALDGAAAFGYVPAEGETDADMARQHAELFRVAIDGRPVVRGNPQMGAPGALAIQPQAPGLGDRIWWGAGTRATAVWTAEQGMNLMSSTLLTEDTGVPFDELQAEQIAMYREAWTARSDGHSRTPRVSVSRSILPLIDDETRHYFGLRAQADVSDQVGYIGADLARFGRSYIGEPEQIAAELAQDAAVAAADTVLVTVPNQLGVEFNARILESIVKDIVPALGS
jgi:alkanesulfonate monooxygenase SsuD/methylene tetrahydromethanopterin reductase-like flavin-dependent oxidoreductase (luciferase family)